MAKRVIVTEEFDCDLCGAALEPHEVITVAFSWQGKGYEFDTGPEEQETLEHNTIGALLAVARVVQGTPGPVRAGPKARSTPTPEKEPSAKGRRRYSFDQYFTDPVGLGVVANGASQLSCPECDYITDVPNTPNGDNTTVQARRIKNLRDHLADEHQVVMWALAAQRRGDSFDPAQAVLG